jgi:capsid protein
VRVVLGVALDKNDIELGYFVRKAGTDGNVDSDFTYVPRYLKSGRFYSMLVRAPGSHFPGQVRSFPMLSSSMDTVDLLSQLTEAASKESITKSAASVMLETEFPPDSGGKLFVDDEKKDAEESKPKNNLPKLNLEDIKPGDIIPLPPGTKPHVIENSATLQLVEQNKQQLKIVAGTLGIPYATLMSDFEKMSFSSCKMMMSKLFLLINLWNYGPIMRLFIEIFREVCLEYYLLKSILPNTEWLSCNWQGQEQPDPDPVKSANADKIRRQEGVKTRSDIVAGKGDDYRALVMQIKYERDIEMEVLGMPMDEFLNIKKSKSETEEPDDDDDDSEDE